MVDPDTRDEPTPLSPRQRRRWLAKLIFLLAGTLSLVLSVGLWFLTEDRETAIFVGLWVPSLFSLGALVAAGEGER
jgi:lipopolysaccharide export LptBFGC system permease protein LptF